jgi:hypothetical protein
MENQGIDRELERLHESFRINQINNAGDLGREILFLVHFLYPKKEDTLPPSLSGKAKLSLRENVKPTRKA